MNVGPNVNDQSWKWLMGWVRELDERAKEQLIGDKDMGVIDAAFMRGRHSVFAELERLDAEVREGDVANMLSTSGKHGV